MADPVLKHVVFIVGAGHSVSACPVPDAPSTSRLTDWIVDGGGPVDRRQWPASVKEVLKSVRDHLSTSGTKPTYESIYTWLWTRYFSSDPTMYRVAWDSEDPFAAIGLDPRDKTADPAYKALRSIEDGVQMALADERFDVRRLPRLTSEAFEDGDVGTLTLITLNHDRLLECSLRQSTEARVFDDGFEGPLDGCGHWDARIGSSARDWSCRVQLIKLHGSIDWWSPTGWNDGGFVCRSVECPRGCDSRPLFLVGTGPKLFQSSNLIFAHQVLDAGHALARATCVVMVGYGFGDVRVNSLWEGASNLKNRDRRKFGHRFPTLAVDVSQDQVLHRLRRLKRSGDLFKMFESPDVPAEFLECEAKDAEWSQCKERLAELETLCARAPG